MKNGLEVIAMKEIDKILDRGKGRWSNDFFEYYFSRKFGENLTSAKNS